MIIPLVGSDGPVGCSTFLGFLQHRVKLGSTSAKPASKVAFYHFISVVRSRLVCKILEYGGLGKHVGNTFPNPYFRLWFDSCVLSMLEQSGKKDKEEKVEERVTLGPKVAEGENVFGVAHIFASFNDTFVVSPNVIFFSSHILPLVHGLSKPARGSSRTVWSFIFFRISDCFVRATSHGLG